MKRSEAEMILLDLVNTGVFDRAVEDDICHVRDCIAATVHGLGEDSFEGASYDCLYANGEACGWRDVETGEVHPPACSVWRDCPDRASFFKGGDGSEMWPPAGATDDVGE